jgi:hypothetical protein
MNITLVIAFTDGEKKTVIAKAADIVAFEERFEMSMARLNENTMKLTHMFWLGWHVCKRTGITHDEFEKWLETVEMVEAPEPKK